MRSSASRTSFLITVLAIVLGPRIAVGCVKPPRNYRARDPELETAGAGPGYNGYIAGGRPIPYAFN